MFMTSFIVSDIVLISSSSKYKHSIYKVFCPSEISYNTNRFYFINRNSTVSLPQYAGSESNMQNELPPARHLIDIKCHLNYGGLKERNLIIIGDY